jgi:hypothetical protein
VNNTRPRRRFVVFAAALTLGVAATISAGLLVSAGTASATATIYTVSRTVGPFSGTAKDGQPGWIDPDREAFSVACNAPRDALLAGAAVINRTTKYGTTEKDVVSLDRIGAYYDPDALVPIHWGTFLRPNGRTGWNTVTLTATCLIRQT